MVRPSSNFSHVEIQKQKQKWQKSDNKSEEGRERARKRRRDGSKGFVAPARGNGARWIYSIVEQAGATVQRQTHCRAGKAFDRFPAVIDLHGYVLMPRRRRVGLGRGL